MNEFYSQIIVKDPRFQSEERVADLALLEPNTRHKILNLMAAAKTNGIELVVFETYRSEQRQLELYRQGASKLKTVGGHHYGLACDLFKIATTKGAVKDDSLVLEQLAHEQGLFCGSDLRSNDIRFTFFDPAGLELIRGGTDEKRGSAPKAEA
ncbi:MAG TPA: M15 family metallopeptidase [Desulfuromonadaceae bacterium]|jgi:hypothetical protein